MSNSEHAVLPDRVVHYGNTEDQVVDLFMSTAPNGTAVLIIHGGFWREPDRKGTYAAARALADAGYLAATMEYRRGKGAWQQTLEDTAAVVDRFAELVADGEWGDEPQALVIAGHSAGGQLGLWAASRPSLPVGHPLHRAESGLSAVIAMAAAADLDSAIKLGLGSGAVEEFIGDESKIETALPLVDPTGLQPAVPVLLMHGDTDAVVPAEISERYVEVQRGRGVGAVEYERVSDAGHLDWMNPASEAWVVLTRALHRISNASYTCQSSSRNETR